MEACADALAWKYTSLGKSEFLDADTVTKITFRLAEFVALVQASMSA